MDSSRWGCLPLPAIVRKIIPLRMCGRFTLIRLADFTNLFPWIVPAEREPAARYNIAPTQSVAAAVNSEPPKIAYLHFGLIPPWAKDPKIGNRLINARVETLTERPAFRTALLRRRCLIPASGFYEWRKNRDRTKTPVYIRLKSDRPMGFAGLWAQWQSPEGAIVPSCTIITTDANALLQPIHDRMPVVLKEDHYHKWLSNEEQDPEELVKLLQPYPSDQMTAVLVSSSVNDPKNESEDCIKPVEDKALTDIARATKKRRGAPSRDTNTNQGTLFHQ